MPLDEGTFAQYPYTRVRYQATSPKQRFGRKAQPQNRRLPVLSAISEGTLVLSLPKLHQLCR